MQALLLRNPELSNCHELARRNVRAVAGHCHPIGPRIHAARKRRLAVRAPSQVHQEARAVRRVRERDLPTGVVTAPSPPAAWPCAIILAWRQPVETVEHLPEDATVEDAMERLYFLAKIERGVQQADAGLGLAHEDVKKQFLR